MVEMPRTLAENGYSNIFIVKR